LQSAYAPSDVALAAPDGAFVPDGAFAPVCAREGSERLPRHTDTHICTCERDKGRHAHLHACEGQRAYAKRYMSINTYTANTDIRVYKYIHSKHRSYITHHSTGKRE
jgi:hypothetical protein